MGSVCPPAAVHRVFAFSAAFPFCGNVDEEAHLDLVCRYSHGDVPRGLGPFSPEMIRLRRYSTAARNFATPLITTR